MRANYYAIIPAGVRYSDIKPNAKLLYGELTALAYKEGYCFASNNYFAELYNVSKNTISLWIKELLTAGFIECEMIYKGKQIIERRLYILPIIETITKNDEGGVIKKEEDNNINSNTINKITYRKLKFEEIVFQCTDISKDVLKEFCDYWTEQNLKGTKMRFEMQKTFDINLRLKRWERNNSNWNKATPKSKIHQSINAHQKAREMIKKMNSNGNM